MGGDRGREWRFHDSFVVASQRQLFGSWPIPHAFLGALGVGKRPSNLCALGRRGIQNAIVSLAAKMLLKYDEIQAEKRHAIWMLH